MRHIALGFLASVAFAGAAFAGDAPLPVIPNTLHPGKITPALDSKDQPVTDRKLLPHWAYDQNTYSNYHPGLSEGHHWWNSDGTEIYFQANWLPEGMMLMKIVDGTHDSFVANGQWCSHNARGRPTAGSAAFKEARGAPAPEDNAKPLDRSQLNNNENDCSPVTDAMPGNHWYKLHLNGHLRDAREQYVLMPGHQ